MPSKARLLAKSMIESPILSEITTNPTITPATITTAVNDVATGNFASIDLLPSTGNDVGDQAFVQSTNRLYIWSGSGWYNIALINTTPTWDSNGQPAATYELSADDPQTATTITLAASDPEGFPITYSHVTGGSMDSIATVSQDSSVFTITPKTSTQAPDGGTGSITFKASDGINILPYVSSFTLNFITIIENSRYTSLLATATGTSDNDNITDSSSNSHSITVNGDTMASTFSPYRSGGYSWDFEGTEFYGSGDAGRGESIEAENNAAAFNVGTNNYSVEGWFRSRSSASNMRLCDFGPYDKISLTHNNSNKVDVKENGTVILTSTSDVFDNNWHFIQVIRTGGYTKLYVDGTQEDSAASTTNIDAISKILVGAWGDYSYGFDGQIADFRFSNIARTAQVPTERLTSDSNTKLLVCSKPYLVDESNTATSLGFLKDSVSTRDYPDPLPSSPYDYNEYAATDNGGSVYFDGSGDSLVTSAGKIPSGSTNFTVSFWFYSTRSGTDENAAIFGQGAGSVLGRVGVFLYSGSSIKYSVDSGDTDTGVSALRNVWYFIELQVTSSTAKMFINGVEESSKSLSNYSAPNTDLTIGNLGSSWNTSLDWTGYISDFLVQIGTPSGSSTVPTAPLSSSGSSLHIKGTDASIIDKAQGGNLELSGNVTGSTTQVKFAGSKSMYFPGSLGDQIIAISGENVDLSAATPFTWEAWCYFNSVSGVIHLMSSNDVGSPAPDRIAFELRNSKLSAMFGGTVIQSGSQVLSTGQWYHLAISRAVGSPYTTTRFFVNGNLDQTAAGWQQAVAIGSFDKWYIGSPTTNNIGNGYHEFNGYMQDVRFTEGLTRYTANFTPPTKSLEG